MSCAPAGKSKVHRSTGSQTVGFLDTQTCASTSPVGYQVKNLRQACLHKEELGEQGHNTIAALRQGENATVEKILLQFPGVTQDSAAETDAAIPVASPPGG